MNAFANASFVVATRSQIAQILRTFGHIYFQRFMLHLHNPSIRRQILLSETVIIFIISGSISFKIEFRNVMIILNFINLFVHMKVISMDLLSFIIILSLLILHFLCNIGILILKRPYHLVHFIYLVVHRVQRHFVLALKSLKASLCRIAFNVFRLVS